MPVPGKVGHDTEQPRAEGPRWIKAPDVIPGAQKGFLGEIFRVIGIAEEQIAKPKNRVLVRKHQRFPGRRVAICGVTDQRRFIQSGLSGEVTVSSYIHRKTLGGSMSRIIIHDHEPEMPKFFDTPGFPAGEENLLEERCGQTNGTLTCLLFALTMFACT